MNLEISKRTWYEKLINDLKELVFTGVVITKHSIGKRILEDELKFDKPEYGSKRIDLLAKDLDVSPRDLYRCIQFAKKYPVIPESVTRDKISWRTIVNDLLPQHRDPSNDLIQASDELNDIIFNIVECCHRILPSVENPVEVKRVLDALIDLNKNFSYLVFECESKLGELLDRGV